MVCCAGACVGDAGGPCAADAGVVVGGAGAGACGGSGGGAARGGSVLVQGEVGRNDPDVEFGLWGGGCDMKRPAWNCVFQLKDKQI